MSASKNPASPETFAAMTEIAERIAAEHTVTINAAAGGGRGRELIDWTYTPSVTVDRGSGTLTVYLPEDRVLNRKASRELLIRVRTAICNAWNAAGYKWAYRRQRCSSAPSGWTWMYVSGFTHMGTFCHTGRYAILVPEAAAVAA
jgi:hypothetical protein